VIKVGWMRSGCSAASFCSRRLLGGDTGGVVLVRSAVVAALVPRFRQWGVVEASKLRPSEWRWQYKDAVNQPVLTEDVVLTHPSEACPCAAAHPPPPSAPRQPNHFCLLWYL